MGPNDVGSHLIERGRDKGQHILVIRLSALGDVAMTVPILSALLQQYPHLKITVLTKGFFKPIFSQLPRTTVFEAEVDSQHKGLTGLFKLYRELKKREITAVADLHNVLRSNVLKFFFTYGRIRVRQIDKGRADKKALTAYKNKKFKHLKTTHLRYADVFGSLGYPLNLSDVHLLTKEDLSKRTLELVGKRDKKWIGIAPFAAFEGKRYPIGQMKEVVSMLGRNGNAKVILFGGGEAEARTLNALSGENSINIVGKLKFSEELALISNLDLMVSMDSGNAHLAAMYGIPTLTLWGVTHPFAGFYPFGQDLNNALLADRKKFPLIPTSVYGNEMPKGYEMAIASIPPAKVYEKIMAMLESKPSMG